MGRKKGSMVKIRQDQTIAFIQNWSTVNERLVGAATIVKQLVEMAEKCSF